MTTSTQTHTPVEAYLRWGCSGGIIYQVKVRLYRALACATSAVIVCTNFIFVCVCVFVRRISTGVQSMPAVTSHLFWQLARAWGRGAPLRDTINVLFVKQSWQQGEKENEEGFKGRGVEISAKEIHEVVISAKQTSSQGRGRRHNMGGWSITDLFCTLSDYAHPKRGLSVSFTPQQEKHFN